MPEYLKKDYFRKLNNKDNDNNNTFTNKYPYIYSSIYNYLRNNTELVITNAELREIPFHMIQYYIPENFLTSINLSGNLIEKGLEHFGNILYLLKNVKSLNFSRNNIRYFPINLLTLPYLEELYLTRNLLSIFPARSVTNSTVTLTQSLLILDLSNNELLEFPVIIQFFKKLTFLNLSGNNINNIDCLINMRLENLEKFFIDNNKIYAIPQNALFRAIPNVVSFTISNNYLTNIPTDLSLLLFLENVNFYGNYIKGIPFQYLLNAHELKEYLRRYHVYTDEQKYYEVKQEEKLKNDYFYYKEKSRMNKTSPVYPSSRNNILNYSYNKIDNNRLLLNSTVYNYNRTNPLFNSYKNNLSNDLILNKYINETYDEDKFERNLWDINNEIHEVETVMKNPRLQPHVKANLRKKFIKLIVDRADLYK